MLLIRAILGIKLISDKRPLDAPFCLVFLEHFIVDEVGKT
jgi:hypothetical protein